ncbi:TAF5-like RNA polymerase II p300/CBP-associated factor-associated factor subunit 5L [Araneus ventricosus]|uniref:TAF5-like RNA polymerase II p300/CBP-associated factor-associated factor subunit 5L n=1 Tax=Araneus ventricosus TaxID=182803 RepID=A0A4Y2HNT9_ARAVE|nr:TAF5-like RNA polymerase II p300/CBP-associated factor-associated factor subunit 5L [Araneus ventricosus]
MIFATRSRFFVRESALESNNGVYFATASIDCTARLWNFKRRTPLINFHHSYEVERLKFDPNCRYLATLSARRIIQLWTVEDGCSMWTIPENDSTYINCITISPDGKYIAYADEKGCIKVWDLSSRQLYSKGTAHRRAIYDLAYNADSSVIVSCAGDRLIRLWDAEKSLLPASKKGTFRKVEKSLKNLQVKIVLGGLLGFVVSAARCHIQDLIYEVHPVCIALQETYLKPTDIAKIKRYSLVRKDNENVSGRASGGVALVVSHDTPSSVITLHTNLQAVAVQVMFSNLVIVCTLYLPPSTSVNDRDLDRLVDELPTPFIIIGDFNGHSPLWSSKNTNPHERQIEEFFNTHSLYLLNNGEDTYFHQRSRTFHSLDLALCTPSLAPYFNFRVGVDLCDSDHFQIFFGPCECRF